MTCQGVEFIEMMFSVLTFVGILLTISFTATTLNVNLQHSTMSPLFPVQVQ
jgi:hypothetical protein